MVMVVFSGDGQFVSIYQLQLDLVKLWDAQFVATISWAKGIESQAGEDVSGRHAAVIFIACKGLKSCLEGLVAQLFNQKTGVLRR